MILWVHEFVEEWKVLWQPLQWQIPGFKLVWRSPGRNAYNPNGIDICIVAERPTWTISSQLEMFPTRVPHK